MRKILFTLFVLAILLSACSPAAPFQITGNQAQAAEMATAAAATPTPTPTTEPGPSYVETRKLDSTLTILNGEESMVITRNGDDVTAQGADYRLAAEGDEEIIGFGEGNIRLFVKSGAIQVSISAGLKFK